MVKKKESKKKIFPKLNEEGKITLTLRKNPWIVSTFFLGAICLIFLIGSLLEVKQDLIEDQLDLCSNVRSTPSWVQGGMVIFEGYSSFENFTADIVVGDLIKENITFVYHSDCGWCKKQIEYFGDSWDKYVESGFTLDCKN